VERVAQHLVAMETEDANVVTPTAQEKSMAAGAHSMTAFRSRLRSVCVCVAPPPARRRRRRQPDTSARASHGAAELAESGFVHLKSVCSAVEVAALVEAIDATALDEQCGDLDVDGIKSLSNPWNRSMHFVQYLDRDPVAVVAENALGGGSGPGGAASPPEHNHVMSMVATRTAPRTAAYSAGLHLDFLPMEVDAELLASGELAMPLFITTAVYCLTAGPAEVGVIAGSHLAGRAPADEEEEFHGAAPTRVEVEAGDVIMYRSESWKCIFANEVRAHASRALRRVVQQRHDPGATFPALIICFAAAAAVCAQSDAPRHALRVHYSQPHIGHRFQPYTGFQFVSRAHQSIALLVPRLPAHAQQAGSPV
jgi:hypothetical protein